MTARSKPPPSRSAATASRRPCKCGEPLVALSCACRPLVTARSHFRRNNMDRTTRRLLAGAVLVTMLAVSSALAQQPAAVRLRGPLEAVAGSRLHATGGRAGHAE